MTGQRIGHYRILKSLARGGQGEVFLAFDEVLHREVALKLLPAGECPDEEKMADFPGEARRAAAVRHENLAVLYDAGTDGANCYLVSEYVPGPAVEEWMAGGSLPLDEVLDTAIQAARALAALHGRGLRHGDVSGANLIRSPGGTIKLVDFGLCRPLPLEDRLPSSSSTFAETENGMAVRTGLSGTPGYMAPELILGNTPGAAADLYALGTVIYQMITGQPPSEAGSPLEICRTTLRDVIPPMSRHRGDVPLDLERIVRQALAKDPARRYRNAEALLQDLMRLRRQLVPGRREETSDSTTALPGKELGVSSPLQALTSRQGKLRILRCSFRFLAGGAAFLAVAGLWLDWPVHVVWPAAILLPAAGLGLMAVHRLWRVCQPPVATPGEGQAFRGLLPFLPADRDLFFGREREIQALLTMTGGPDFRFGVLHGESGSGKTSLLQAGLVPRWWESGTVPLYCRSSRDPLGTLEEEARRASLLSREQAESLPAYLNRVAENMQAGVLIVCDQFEEFLTLVPEGPERESFLELAGTIAGDRTGRLKLLLAIRSDFLYLIGTGLAGRVPEPLQSGGLFHLRNLTAGQAESIISSLAARTVLPLTPGLCREAARDLASRGSVLASELQIVGEQLQNRGLFTVEEYRRAGGKEALVSGYLEEVLRASGDLRTISLLLAALISPENTRLTLAVEEIATRTRLQAGTIRRLLEHLIRFHLVQELPEETPVRYQLMHDYLITPFNRATGKVMDARQHANLLFRQYQASHESVPATRIPLDKLWFIRRYSDLARGSQSTALMRKSLWSGLWKASILLLLLAGVTISVSALLSIREDWESIQLRDGHAAAALQAVFSPDGSRLISTGEDGTVLIWDFARRVVLATLKEHRGAVNAVACSPDGRYFATGGNDREILVWNMKDFKTVTRLPGYLRPVRWLAFTSGSRCLVSSGERHFTSRDCTSWQKQGEFSTESMLNYGNFLLFSAGRQLLHTDGLLRDRLTGRVTSGWLPEKQDANWMAVSADGRTLITIDSLGEVSGWDIPGRTLRFRSSAHQDHGRAAAISPDGRLAATGAESIILWNTDPFGKICRLDYPAIVWSLVFSPDGRWLVSTHSDGAILVWDVKERELAASFTGHCGPVQSVSFSSDGRQVASGSDDRSIIIWDLRQRAKYKVLTGSASRVRAVSFSPVRPELYSCDQSGAIMKWDLVTEQKQILLAPPAGRGPCYAAAATPDGNWLATSRGSIFLRDPARMIDFFRGTIYSIRFSRDGKTMAMVNHYGDVRLFDPQTWRERQAIQVRSSAMVTCDFSPDGSRIVTGDDQGMVWLWRTGPLQRLELLGRHEARVKAVVYAPDGLQVASAGDDRTIRLWDVRRWRLITTIDTHTAPVLSLAFSPDGRQLVSGEHDHSVRLHIRHRTLWGRRLD